MKKYLILICCAFSLTCISAQSELKGIPVSIAYLGQALIQPGVKISTEFNLKKFTQPANTGRSKNVYISPQIGFFTRPGIQNNLLVNTEIGIRRRNNENGFFTAFSLGAGYLREYQILSTSINLGDGKISSKNMEGRGFFLPSLNLEFGKSLNNSMDWYSKGSFGKKINASKQETTLAFIELGLRFWFGIR